MAFNSPISAAVKEDIIKVSNKIIDNNVQIKLIDDYIDNLNNTYTAQQKKLLNSRKEFQTSVAVLYKLTLYPKESLLIPSFNREQILNMYVIINYWSSHAYQQIYKIYTQLNAIKENTKKLNLAEQKLQRLNIDLTNNKNYLTKLLQKNNLSADNINKINQIRQNLQYNIKNLQINQTFFDTLSDISLTKEEILLDNNFLQKNKGSFAIPSSGYIYSHFKDSKYYDINYYGMVFVAQANTNIVSPGNGEIIFLNTLNKYDMVIIIKHSPSYVSIISGNIIPNIHLANKVTKGQIIAKTANSTTAVYFEIDNKNNPVNPEDWLIKGALNDK
ncbi:murein hydrolase activator EnvC family protein [Rickettsiales bacterium LUAb2]